MTRFLSRSTIWKIPSIVQTGDRSLYEVQDSSMQEVPRQTVTPYVIRLSARSSFRTGLSIVIDI